MNKGKHIGLIYKVRGWLGVANTWHRPRKMNPQF